MEVGRITQLNANPGNRWINLAFSETGRPHPSEPLQIGDGVEWYIEPQDCPFVGQITAYKPPYQSSVWVQVDSSHRPGGDYNFVVRGRVSGFIEPLPNTVYPLPFMK
jgi:hypothetical protein